MNYQSKIADQRDQLLLALEILARETSVASLKRAVHKLETDPYWTSAHTDSRAAAKELRDLLICKQR
jgi:hypothetical protein